MGQEVSTLAPVVPRSERIQIMTDKSSTISVVFGPKQQNYSGGPVYRVGVSIGAELPPQPSEHEYICLKCGVRASLPNRRGNGKGKK